MESVRRARRKGGGNEPAGVLRVQGEAEEGSGVTSEGSLVGKTWSLPLLGSRYGDEGGSAPLSHRCPLPNPWEIKSR